MFALALKNIFYYKSRSITTIILTFVSALFFIVFVSMQDGSHDSMLHNALKVYSGAIEVYKKDYRDIGGNEYLISDVKTIEKELAKIDGIKSFTARYETYGLISSDNYSVASMVAGVEPEKEKVMSMLEVALVDGSFLKSKNENSIYIGVELAKKLHVKVGDEVSFIGSASDNSFAADIFKVCGTFRTGSFEFDSSGSFVSRSYFDELMLSENIASYISIDVEDLNSVDMLRAQIESVTSDELEIVSWKTLMKAMVEAMEVDSVFGYISMSLFFVVIFFVIMIFGFINVSSRIKEFGILRCIGLSRQDIRKLLLYEIFILSSLAVLVALPIGSYIAYYYSVNPIIIEGISEMYKDYGIISDEMPFSFNLFTISWNVLTIYILNFISVIYPIVFINSFKPIEASKHV